MKEGERKILIAATGIICMLRIASVFFSQGLIHDELAYLGIARSIDEVLTLGDITGIGIESWRPPLWPHMLALWFLIAGISIEAGRFLSAFIGIAGIAAIYFLGKKLYNERIGLYSALFLALNPEHWFFSTKALIEPLLILMEIVFLLCLWLSLRNSRYLIPTVVLLPLLFMTKYSLILFSIVFALFIFLEKREFLKDKNLWIGAILAVMVMLPWMLSNVSQFGTLFGAPDTQFRQSGISSAIDPYYIYTIPLQMAAILPLSLAGLWMIWKRRPENNRLFFAMAAVIIIVFIVGLSFIDVKRERYLMPIIPPLTIAAAYCLANFPAGKQKKAAYITALIALVAVINIGIFAYGSANYPSVDRFIGLEKAGYFIAENCTGKKISGNHVFVWWFAHQKAYATGEIAATDGACVVFDGYVYRNDNEREKALEELKGYKIAFRYNDVAVYVNK